MLLSANEIETPTLLLKAAVPEALVPIKLPATTLPVEPALLMKTPWLVPPEIKLRAAGVVPPMLLAGESLMSRLVPYWPV